MPIDSWDEIRTAWQVVRSGTVSGAAELESGNAAEDGDGDQQSAEGDVEAATFPVHRGGAPAVVFVLHPVHGAPASTRHVRGGRGD
mgnify:CR=1 FL=1